MPGDFTAVVPVCSGRLWEVTGESVRDLELMQNKDLLQLCMPKIDLKLAYIRRWAGTLPKGGNRADWNACEPAGVVPNPFFSSASVALGHHSPPPHLPVLLILARGAALLQQLSLITWHWASGLFRPVQCWVSKCNQSCSRSKEEWGSPREGARVHSQAKEVGRERMLLVLLWSSWTIE